MNPRRAAAEALMQIEKGAYSNLALKEVLPALKDAKDRAFCTALVYTTLENRYFLDEVLRRYAKGGTKPAARAVLYLGLCQLLVMGEPDHAAVDQSVKLIKELGKPALAGFVNGVLRSAAREKAQLKPPMGNDPESLSIRYSTPRWIVERFCRRFGAEVAEGILAYRPKELCLRALPGTELAGRRGRFCSDVFYVSAAGEDVAKSPLFLEGKIAVQSEASALVAKMADVGPGMKVLDACAAPGGKTAAMGAAMAGTPVTAWDVHPHRVALIEATCKRMGVAVAARVQDAREFCPELAGAFDRVLVDAPCSGLGVSGKPDIRQNKKESDVEELQKTQKQILSACCRYVKPGGVLVYSTCTISKEENEDVADWFLKEHPEFCPGEILRFLPEDFDKARAAGGRVQLLPPIDGIDGFFIARMARR